MAEFFYNNKKRTRLKSGASAPLMIWVVVVLPVENVFGNVRIGEHCPNRLAKIIRCRQRQVALGNKIGKHGFCFRYPVNLGTGGEKRDFPPKAVLFTPIASLYSEQQLEVTMI